MRRRLSAPRRELRPPQRPPADTAGLRAGRDLSRPRRGWVRQKSTCPKRTSSGLEVALEQLEVLDELPFHRAAEPRRASASARPSSRRGRRTSRASGRRPPRGRARRSSGSAPRRRAAKTGSGAGTRWTSRIEVARRPMNVRTSLIRAPSRSLPSSSADSALDCHSGSRETSVRYSKTSSRGLPISSVCSTSITRRAYRWRCAGRSGPGGARPAGGRGRLGAGAGLPASERSRQVARTTGQFLFSLAAPMNDCGVLELGGSRGYSTIWLAAGVRYFSGRVVSIEHDPAKAEAWRRNIADAGLEEWAELVEGDAFEVLVAGRRTSSTSSSWTPRRTTTSGSSRWRGRRSSRAR